MNNNTPREKSGLPPKIIVLLPCAVIAAMGLNMMNFSLLFYVRDVLNASSGVASIFAAMFTLSYSVSCFLMRPVFNRLIPRFSIILAVVLISLWIFSILMIQVLAAAFVFMVLIGISNSFFWSPLMGWYSAGIESRTLSRYLSYFNISWSSGSIVGPFLAGLLFEQSPRAPVYASIACFLTVALYVSVTSYGMPQIRSDRYREKRPNRKNRSRQTDNSTFLRFPAWLVLYVAFLMTGVVATVFPIYARSLLNFSESSIGLLMLFRNLCMVIGFYIIGKTVFWHFKPWWIIGILGFHILMVILLLAAGSYASFVILFMLLGLLVSLIYNNSVFHGLSGSSQRAHRMAVHEALLAGGAVTGSMAGGLIFQNSGFAAVLYVCLAAAVIAVLPVTVLLLRYRFR